MITLRSEQRHVVAAHDREGLARTVQDHLRTCFGPALEPRDEEALAEAIRSLIEHAVSLGLVSPRHVCGVANLAATFGWGFLQQPANAWMLDDFLANERLGTPGQRLALLVDRCLWQMKVREHNEALRGSVLGPR
jgi:hypothetical protein